MSRVSLQESVNHNPQKVGIAEDQFSSYTVHEWFHAGSNGTSRIWMAARLN
jgi:hypothetical protein